jgi:hypothetical protein
MATTTNYGWTTPDDTALVKDGASAIRTLGSSVDTTTKALNPSTTLGDIEYRSSTANTNTRLGIGSAGQVLTVAGGVPSWATASGGGTYQTFTPSYQDITIGNGTSTCRYTTVGKLVHVETMLIFGSTTSITGTSLFLTLPVEAKTAGYPIRSIIGFGNPGNTTNYGMGDFSTSTTMRILCFDASSTYVKESNVASNIPFTWGTNKYLSISLVYEAL